MKHLYQRTLILLAVCALAGAAALAATTTGRVTFNRAVTVNGTPVEAGIYKVRFDDATGEFTVLDGKKVVARVTARLEKLPAETQSSYSLRAEGGGSALVSIVIARTRREFRS
ncbi:MAG TPA: hypothetical protein VN256_07785 [Pyrinomonadaceae bacterium]|nr:hypothetical protein [Pyrinomonadaceae bacterium]